MAVKWVIAEPHPDCAATLLDGGPLHAPDHWLAEAVNVLWAKHRLGQLPDADARLELLLRAPIVTTPVARLARQAYAIAAENDVTVYDALYLALAWERALPFVTADLRLIRKVAAPPLRPLLRWVGDLSLSSPNAPPNPPP